MTDVYGVENFEPDYCEKDLSNLANAMHNITSILLIGMPGCGKGRLFDFLLHKPGILEQYALSENWKVVLVDADVVGPKASDVYNELLFALTGTRTDSDASLGSVKNELRSAVRSLKADIHLGVIFDNFTRNLQNALGKDFFDYLLGLRNARPHLNIVYVFVANLTIDLEGFYRSRRLFDGGIDRCTRWLSCFGRTDAFFSIERQLGRVGAEPDALTEEQKETIYHLGGGHALLNRHLTHLMLDGEISVHTQPAQVLEHAGVQAACRAIWNDLTPTYQNFLIDLGSNVLTSADAPDDILRKYGVLDDEGALFSPIFKEFVRNQEKVPVVLDLTVDEARGVIIVKRNRDTDVAVSLRGLDVRESRLLLHLVEHKGTCCSKDDLIEVGWPQDYKKGESRTDQVLSREIQQIRKWVEDQELLSQLVEINAVYGEGYILVLHD